VTLPTAFQLPSNRLPTGVCVTPPIPPFSWNGARGRLEAPARSNRGLAMAPAMKREALSAHPQGLDHGQLAGVDAVKDIG
jgi:hypothetical protein